MGLVRRTAAVVVPVGLVVGAVAYGIAHDASGSDDTVGLCTTRVNGLSVVLEADQARNATLISAVSVRRGMPAHAATIALATALQESKLRNLRGGDRDSLGLFQQRPSQGWGTPAQIMDPLHATNAFYDALEKVAGYQTLPVTQAAQEVQRSGFPAAYAVYERDARALASAMTGYSPAAFSCHVSSPTGQPDPIARRAVGLRRALGTAFGSADVSVAAGARLRVAARTGPRGWAIASYVVARAASLGVHHVSFAGRTWTAGSNAGWRRRPHRSADMVVVD